MASALVARAVYKAMARKAKGTTLEDEFLSNAR
jgi:hypothetical protein